MSEHRLRDLALSDTGFVFDPCSGATFTVNATGLCVLQALKEGLPRAAITERLAGRFEVHGGDVGRDVDEFVSTLGQHGIVPEGFRL